MSEQSIAEKRRFIGLMLSAGRSKHTAIAVLDYYHGKGRLFIVESIPKMLSNNEAYMDKELCEHILKLTDAVNSCVYTNAPLTLPPCMRCVLEKCPGIVLCQDQSTVFMLQNFEKLKKKRKNLKQFIPYTQRPEEVMLRILAPELVPPHEAMGGSLAPITSRAAFLKKRLTGLEFFEAYPKGSIARLLETLQLPSHYSSSYNDIKLGKRIRGYFIDRLESQTDIFIYDNDKEQLISSPILFEAMVLALIGVLDFKGQTERPVPDYPKEQSFIRIPKRDLKF